MLKLASSRWGTWLSLSALAAGAVLLGGTAGAEGAYTWQTRDGVDAYANDSRDIPRRYRAEAQPTELGSLRTYPRYTPVDATAARHYADGVANRVAYLRALNADLSAARVAPAAGRAQVVVRIDGDQAIPEIAVATGAGDAAEPVVTETLRVKVRGLDVTRHNTIVRQGDRVLAVIKPRPHQGSVAFKSEKEIED